MRTIRRKISGQVSKRLAAICRRSSVFEIFALIRSHVNETNKIDENSYVQNFKNPKSSFVTTSTKKIQEKFENFRLRFVGEVAF